VEGKAKGDRPPCPGAVSGPPGHNKTSPPAPRPCSGGGNSRNSSHGIVLAPFALGGALLALATKVRRNTKRLVRARVRRGRQSRLAS